MSSMEKIDLIIQNRLGVGECVRIIKGDVGNLTLSISLTPYEWETRA